MNDQLKTALKMFGSTILVTLILDVVLRNVIFSSAISFLICVVYFYEPKKVEARYNKRKAEEENKLNPSSVSEIKTKKKKK